jgi:hypothetical protein
LQPGSPDHPVEAWLPATTGIAPARVPVSLAHPGGGVPGSFRRGVGPPAPPRHAPRRLR